MPVQFVTAKTGYIFKMTYLGRQNGLSEKFKPTSLSYKQYSRRVPKKWISKGYVVEERA